MSQFITFAGFQSIIRGCGLRRFADKISGGKMKKHLKYVPLEISGTELNTFVNRLIDRLYHEFWSENEEYAKKEEIRLRIERNIYSVLESSSK
jgi:hypothetical protein